MCLPTNAVYVPEHPGAEELFFCFIVSLMSTHGQGVVAVIATSLRYALRVALLFYFIPSYSSRACIPGNDALF